ncbi:MAG: hypothetical protein H6842_13680 [Rhodospirillaceae bacterium]|nr:hypothetical protein [Rhodospirillaceae bacterium]
MNAMLNSVDLSPHQELAFPFLQSAVQIDQARQNPDDRDALMAVLENNALLWTHIKTYFSGHFDEIPSEYREFLVRMSDFMMRSAIVLNRSMDLDLMDKLVALNLNMCEQILSAQKNGTAAHA